MIRKVWFGLLTLLGDLGEVPAVASSGELQPQ